MFNFLLLKYLCVQGCIQGKLQINRRNFTRICLQIKRINNIEIILKIRRYGNYHEIVSDGTSGKCDIPSILEENSDQFSSDKFLPGQIVWAKLNRNPW